MNFILVNFGTDESYGTWNQKRFGFTTVADAVTAGEEVKGTGFVVIASYYEPGTNDDEMKVVYEENTEEVTIKTFPHISVTRK